MKLIPATHDISRNRVADYLLDRGITMVHVLSRRDGVVIPEFCKAHPVVHLNFSYRFGIDDFVVDEKGIRASLSFNGQPQFCDIPWEAVCGISSQVTDEFFVWIDAFADSEIVHLLPQDVAAEFAHVKEVPILDELPELLKFATDGARAEYSSRHQKDDEGGEEDEDDEEDQTEYPPLRFV